MKRKFKLSQLHRSCAVALRRAFPQVTTLSDATQSIAIEVREGDRKVATPFSPESCAMAQACHRQLQADGAVITLTKAYVVRGTHATRYKVPTTVQREITSFDRHGDFRAGVFLLSRMPPANRLGAEKRRPKDRHTGKGERLGRVTPKVLRGKTVGIRQSA